MRSSFSVVLLLLPLSTFALPHQRRDQIIAIPESNDYTPALSSASHSIPPGATFPVHANEGKYLGPPTTKPGLGPLEQLSDQEKATLFAETAAFKVAQQQKIASFEAAQAQRAAQYEQVLRNEESAFLARQMAKVNAMLNRETTPAVYINMPSTARPLPPSAH